MLLKNIPNLFSWDHKWPKITSVWQTVYKLFFHIQVKNSHSVNTSLAVSLLLCMLYDKYLQLVLFLYIIITGIIKPNIIVFFLHFLSYIVFFT